MTLEEIVIDIQKGNTGMITELWKQTVDFIRMCAREFYAPSLEEDLIQEAYFGLIQAVNRFDSEKECKFLTYAEHHIKNSMRRFLYSSRHGIRIPEHTATKVSQYNRLVSDFLRIYHRKPTTEEIRIFLKVQNPEQLKAAAMNATSLDKELNEDGLTLSDTVPAPDESENIIEQIFFEELQRDLWDSVGKLSEELRETILKRYKDGHSIEEIKKELHISQGIYYKNLRTALKKLKRDQNLKKYHEELYSRGLRGTGYGTFTRTWTSSTERAAMWFLEK